MTQHQHPTASIDVYLRSYFWVPCALSLNTPAVLHINHCTHKHQTAPADQPLDFTGLRFVVLTLGSLTCAMPRFELEAQINTSLHGWQGSRPTAL
jgi:hypothetical protein